MPDNNTPIQGNPGPESQQGSPTPPPPSNEPPKDTGPSTEAVAALAAAEKLVADNKAAKDAEAAAKAKPDPLDMTPDAEEQRVAAEKLQAEKDADKDNDNTPLDIDQWGTTGHEGGDAVLGLLQNAGVSPEEAKALLFDAVKGGDLKKVDMKALEEAVGKDKAVLVMAGAKAFLTDTAERNTQIVKDIKEVAGGEENWAKVTKWAKNDSGISDDKMAEYIEMIDKGGAQARFAASELVTAYNASTSNTTLETPGVPPVTEGDTSNTPGGRKLSRNEYAAEVEKLHGRGRVPTAAEMNELSAARARGRG